MTAIKAKAIFIALMRCLVAAVFIGALVSALVIGGTEIMMGFDADLTREMRPGLFIVAMTFITPLMFLLALTVEYKPAYTRIINSHQVYNTYTR